jgi:anti-sigma factor RsiW
MNCSDFDSKGYALGELTASELRDAETHLASCETCRQEVAHLQLTVTALKRLPDREIPRRIAFVSDPVFEPSWWQRFWASGPKMGFAAASMLAGAIVLHGFAARPTLPAPAAQAVTEADVQARVKTEVERMLPAAVDERVKAQLQPAIAEMSAKLDGIENRQLVRVNRQIEDQRRADLREMRGAFELFEKRLNVMYLTAAKYGGD